MKKTYSILNDDYETLYSTTVYNKEVLTAEFEKAVRAAKEGETIHYGFEDKKFAFGSSLMVEIRKGKAMLCVIKGDKCYYKEYQFKTPEPVIVQPMVITVGKQPVTLTSETIAATRQYYIDNALACIKEAESGEVKVNDLPKYIAWNQDRIEKFKTGESDKTFTFIQQAYYIQTGISVPLL